MKTKKEWLISVRMLSAIARYDTSLSFSAFLKEHKSLSPTDTERQITVHQAVLSFENGGYELILPGDGKDETRILWKTGNPKVTVLRRGEMQSEMHFRPRAKTRTVYRTPFGTLEGELFTEEIQNTLTPERGFLAIRYIMSLGGSLQACTVKITAD